MKYSIMVFTFGMFFLAACSESEETIAPTKSLPTPTLEDNHSIPNTDATFYMYWSSFEDDKPAAEGEILLRDLVDGGIHLKDVWFPSGPSPCGAPGAVTVVVVVLSNPDARILDFGFTSDPEEWWIINCGVAKLWHYSFE